MGIVENNAHWKTGERPDLNHKIKSNRDLETLHALESARHNCKFFLKDGELKVKSKSYWTRENSKGCWNEVRVLL